MIRFYPDRALPPYSYVPGRFPHPVSDVRGHSYQATPAANNKGDEQRSSSPASIALGWRGSPDYLFGIDLFNHGFYWEAHESWEQLWIALGRSGRDADFIKGLIKLAAAGVKAREGRAIGVARHSRRALELFRSVAATESGSGKEIYCGRLDLEFLCQAADSVSENADRIVAFAGDSLNAMLPVELSLADV